MASLQTQQQPWLMVSHGKGHKLRHHTFFNASKNRYYERSIPEFYNKQVVPTSYGWLALLDLITAKSYLFNPATLEKIHLPPIKLHPNPKIRILYNCILSKSPDDPDCHVLFCAFTYPCVLFCRLGDDYFVETTKCIGDDTFWNAINFNGKVYTCTGRGKLSEIEFAGQELIVKQSVNDEGKPCQISVPPHKGVEDFDGLYVVESCGELLLVHQVDDDSLRSIYFRIYKINLVQGEFEELRNIGDRSIFLCSCLSMSAAITYNNNNNLGGGGELQKNSIYYIGYDNNLYVYDIAVQGTTAVEPCHLKGNSALKSWIML